MTFQLNKIKRIELIAVALLLPFLAMASSTAGSVDLGGLLGFMKDLNTSQTGEIITYIGFWWISDTTIFTSKAMGCDGNGGHSFNYQLRPCGTDCFIRCWCSNSLIIWEIFYV